MKNNPPPKLDFILLTDKGKLLLNFFCHKVPVVIAARAIKQVTSPSFGNSSPKSTPSTSKEPIKPNIIPTHCLHPITSL